MKTKSLSIFLKSLLGVAFIAIPLSIVTPIMLSSSRKGELEEHANKIQLKPTDLGKNTLPTNINDLKTVSNYIEGIPPITNSIIPTVKAIRNQNNDKGLLSIVINYSRENKNFEKEYRVFGFKTTEMQNIDDVNDYVNKTKFTLIPTDLGTKTLPNKINSINGIYQYIQGFPKEFNGVNAKPISVQKQNNDDGSLNITLEFSKGSQKIQRNYDVVGFKTNAMQNIDEVNDFINKVSVKLNLLPTELGKKTLPEAITNINNIDDYVEGFPNSQNNITIEKYKVSKQNNDSGSLTITLKFSRNGYSKEREYVVYGFKDTKTQNKDDVNGFIQQLGDLNLLPTELGKKTLPQNITNIAEINKYVNNLPVGSNGVNVEAIVISNQNNDSGSLVVRIKYSKQFYSTTKDYLVSGFKTTDMQDNDDLISFVNNLQINLVPTILGQNTLPNNINNPETIKEYIDNIPNSTNEISIIPKTIKNQNNDNGSLTITLEFVKGAQRLTKDYDASGFKTTLMQNRDDTENFINNLGQVNLAPTDLGKRTLPLDITSHININNYVNNIPTSSQDVNVEVTSVTKQNNNDGSLAIVIQYSKGQYSTTREYVVYGFKTTNMQDLDDINNVINNLNIQLKPTDLGKKTLPNDINQVNTIANYVNGIPKGTNGVNISTQAVTNQNNDDGSLTIALQFEKGNQMLIKEYSVQGFKTTAMQNKDDTDAYADLQVNLVPTPLGKITLPTAIKDINTIFNYVEGFPNDYNGIVVTKVSVIKQNNNDGSLAIVLKYSKGQYSTTREYIVQGFKTTAMQDSDDLNVFVNNLNVNLSPTTLGAQTFPDHITDINTINQYVQGIPTGTNGVNVRVTKIINRDNENGAMTIEIEYSKGASSISKTYKINGLKATTNALDYQFNLDINNKTIDLIRYIGNKTEVYIPEWFSVNGQVFRVRNIDNNLFANYRNSTTKLINKVIINKNIGRVDASGLFRDLPLLTEVSLPYTWTLQFEMFANTPQLYKLDINPNVTTIEKRCFAGSGIFELNLPNVTTISTEAFLNSDIANLTISNNLSEIGERAFKGSNIVNFKFNGGSWRGTNCELKESAFENARYLKTFSLGLTANDHIGRWNVYAYAFKDTPIDEINFWGLETLRFKGPWVIKNTGVKILRLPSTGNSGTDTKEWTYYWQRSGTNYRIKIYADINLDANYGGNKNNFSSVYYLTRSGDATWTYYNSDGTKCKYQDY